jgi:FkbM family methyltransferase
VTRLRAKTVGRTVLRPFLGKARFQGLFETLYEVSLAGLNVGEGNHPKLSGEGHVIDLVCRRLVGREPIILFDVGANVGVYTKALLDAFSGSATVYAFEPAPSAFKLLASNLDDAKNVQLRNIGFGERQGPAVLHSAGPGSKLGSLYEIGDRLARAGAAVTLDEQIRLTTIDRFCSEEEIDRIDFLKIDVEGHELRVLEGAAEMLAGSRIDAIQFEFSAANVESRTYFRDFWNLLRPHYVLCRVLQDGIRPIQSYSESLELFKRATNYVALPDDHLVQGVHR